MCTLKQFVIILCIVWHYLILLPRPRISQYDQPPSPVLHMVQEVWLAWLNQDRL